MKIALLANANQMFVCADDGGAAPLIANRAGVGSWEEFEVYTKNASGQYVPLDLEALIASIVAAMLPPQPLNPQPPAIAPWATFAGSAQDWFGQLVYGKPFGQETLLALEPTLNLNRWQLTPANADGQRTKIRPPNGPWVRVGFGEGHWVWVEQP